MTNDVTDLSAPIIVGFGIVGKALARALTRRGMRPVVVEDLPSDSGRAAADALGIELVDAPSAERLDELLACSSVLLPSPGIPDHHQCFAAAASAGVPVRSEFDLARIWDDRPLVAITGTNGKTTVTTIVTAGLERSGVAAAAVGNTDLPLITAIDDETTEVFVVEASSFRLGHSHCFSPQVATWLNFAPDHLDAHASLADYERAKASIWSHLDATAIVVANADDPVVRRHLPEEGHIELFSTLDPAADWRVVDGSLVGPDGPLMAVDDLARSRPHDVQNALAAAATARAAGADRAAMAETLAGFKGLPHRLELVGEWDGVEWYNDSKATVPQATEAAVGGFGSVVLIAGGRNKGLALDSLRSTAPPVRSVVAIGEAGDEVMAAFDQMVPVMTAVSMDAAVAAAHSIAEPGDVVLLSPGCTSFDWYPNYVERGLDFCRIVLKKVGRG